jgi:hypothetical protein
MYTWGYLKNACLAKLDMSADDAIKMGIMNKFPYYANEALGQIVSSIKPKHTYAQFNVVEESHLMCILQNRYKDITNWDFLHWGKCEYENFDKAHKDAWDTYNYYSFVNQPVRMPEDFVSFGDQDNYVEICNRMVVATDDEYKTYGNCEIIFFKGGNYHISYDAKWFEFLPETDDNVKLDIPQDILDAIPSYIVSQCFKIDDEQKAQIYRNEYEMFLARITDDLYYSNKKFHHRWE